MRSKAAVATLLTVLVAGGGCSSSVSAPDREGVAADLRERSGVQLGPQSSAGQFPTLAELTEEQAVDLALLNNAAFQEQLAELGLSRADVIQAGLITNPDLMVLIPVGPKQAEGTITAPIEALWLRDKRIAAARQSADRTVLRLSQAGLDLIRDVRLAYAELVLARRRLALYQEALRLREQVFGLVEARVRAGDASQLDSLTARIDAMRAGQDARSLIHNVAIAEERLRALLGAGAVRTPIAGNPHNDVSIGQWDVESFVKDAVAGRADVKGAELAVASARGRRSLARMDWFNFSVIVDANEKGTKGFEVGPGLRLTLPIFNQNQGMIARADAEVERALRQQKTLNDRVILEVREAHARLVQAKEDLDAWRSRVLPALEEAVTVSQSAYRNGQTPLVQVLDTARQLLDARVRDAQAAADLRKARAELERSVGRRLDSHATTRPTERQP